MTTNPLRDQPVADVVVGVDGSPASVNAVRYGLREAKRLGARLRVVHVTPEYETFAYPFVIPDVELLDTGRAIVKDVCERADAPDSGVEIDVVVRRGPRVATLNGLARNASILVVGADRQSMPARIITGNITAGVAASSAAPVVVVPETWRAEEASKGKVLVGMKAGAQGHELLGEGFTLADARDARLVLLHAWKLPSGYDDVVSDPVSVADWETRARGEMSDLAVDWEAAFPAVPVDLQVAHDQAAHALIEASRTADELVLARRARGITAALHLGATARAVLRGAQCPVRIVPPGHAVSMPDLVLESSGAATK
ncbi:universal stress protein [Nocardioides sp. GXZ039]|uniref:universal stress protein n=1 Tax=Nocardioides sp. GXZ039 TaxID=3136018 RepID=UPI0030F47F71